MSTYPACRYTVENGALISEVVHGPDEEREGWEPTPHRFRALTVDEFRAGGHSPEDAAKLHQRELRRVALVFKGHSLDESEALADQEPLPARADGNQEAEQAMQEIWAILCPDCGPDDFKAITAAVAANQALIAAAEKSLAAKEAESADMVAKFTKNWDKLTAECERLKKAAKAKPAKDQPEAPASE